MLYSVYNFNNNNNNNNNNMLCPAIVKFVCPLVEIRIAFGVTFVKHFTVNMLPHLYNACAHSFYSHENVFIACWLVCSRWWWWSPELWRQLDVWQQITVCLDLSPWCFAFSSDITSNSYTLTVGDLCCFCPLLIQCFVDVLFSIPTLIFVFLSLFIASCYCQ